VIPDPAFKRIRTQGFDKQKLKERNTAEKMQNSYLFLIKIAIYLSLGLRKGCPSYRRSLQPSKNEIY
jgi:hypothetical protein